MTLRNEVNQQLNDLRIESEIVKNQVDQLADAPITTMPEDIRIMYLGKITISMLNQGVRLKNMKSGYERAYGEIYPEVVERIQGDLDIFLTAFEEYKKKLNKIAKKHPVAERICQIKGLTPYRLAIMMSYIKDISRFATPSKLCVYSGVASKHGFKLTKANLKHIRKIDQQLNPNREGEFGYNTKLQKECFILSESLIKAKGYFHDVYQSQKERLMEKKRNQGGTFIATEEHKKDKYTVGEEYIVGRKLQTLRMWAHRNAQWRIVRNVMHLLYTEWCLHVGIEPRNPYPHEYLGHQQYHDLDFVIDYEANQKRDRDAA
jgi:hypothetical protein